MKILVTGANGYLGTGVVEELLERGYTVVATDIKVDDIDERAEKIASNLFQVENPFEYFGKPDVVLHLAWRDGFRHQSEAHLIDLPNHYSFLEKMVKSGIPQVTVMGSMHEVGFFEGEVDENVPTNPLSLYGVAKDALRKSLQILTNEYPFKFQWIRGFYIVSKTERGCSIFSKLIQASMSGEKEFPFTSGLNKYDFISYEDFCKQIASVVCQKEVDGIINCCSGNAVPLKDVVEKFIKENNLEIRLVYNAFPDRIYDSKEIWGNVDKIKKIMDN